MTLQEQIRLRSYFIWQKEDRPTGKDLEHWYCAEAQLVAEQEKDFQISRSR